jgi:hypothetical protein
VSATSTLTVTDASVVSLAIDPDASIAQSTTKQYKATATLSDGSTIDVTNDVSWFSSDIGISGINNAFGFRGLAQAGTTAGQTTITAKLMGVSASSVLTVTSSSLAQLESITVTPSNATAEIGSTAQFTAIGKFSDGTEQDITNSVIWSSASTNIASVSNATGQ